MLISSATQDKINKEASDNIKVALAHFVKTENINVEAYVRDPLTVYVRYNTGDRSAQSKMTPHAMTKNMSDKLNELYGADFDEGYIQSGGPTGIAIQYSARTTTGSLF